MNTQPQPGHSTSRPIRVAVCDDHPIVRRGIANELAQCLNIVLGGEAVNGLEVLRIVRTAALDVIVLDLNMPEMRIEDLLTEIGGCQEAPRVLILTAHNDVEYMLATLKAGASGYMLKDEPPELITTAVRAVARGDTWFSAAVMVQVMTHTTSRPRTAALPDLSAREIEVLDLLTEGQANREIGDRLCISERTVRFHLRNIYDKLGVQRRGEAIAWGLRIKLQPGGAPRFPAAQGASISV